MTVRSRFGAAAASFALALWCAPAALAQFVPHEPLNPAKAQSLPFTPLSIDSGGQVHSFQVEVADDDRERATGLMHRNHMDADKGMIFDFKREQPASFWMRNTFIPLDMLFIKADGTIAAIAANTIPHDERPVGPNVRVQAVLELAGGTAAKLGLKPGDTVHHQIFGNEK